MPRYSGQTAYYVTDLTTRFVRDTTKNVKARSKGGIHRRTLSPILRVPDVLSVLGALLPPFPRASAFDC